MIWLSSPFFFADIQILMGSLVYLRHGIENSPYRSLLETNQWAEICNIFTRDACALLGLSVESPLSVRYERKTELYFWFCCHPSLSFFIKDLNPSFSWLFLFFLEQYQIILVWFFPCFSFASGCMALPVLMNIKQVIEQRQCSGVWTHKDELPVRA